MMLKEKLKELRQQKKWTQEDLALRINVTRQTISKWEQGINEPDLKTLEELSNIFEVSLLELLGKEEGIKKNK